MIWPDAHSAPALAMPMGVAIGACLMILLALYTAIRSALGDRSAWGYTQMIDEESADPGQKKAGAGAGSDAASTAAAGASKAEAADNAPGASKARAPGTSAPAAAPAAAARDGGSTAVARPDEGLFFVINGFYMAMREKFTRPGASIYYYLVEWDAAKLSWADFRAKVLGATDPAAAIEGTLRKQIYQTWEALGLPGEPDVGDNGVHASASPFEALCERLNWLGAKLEADVFGKAMLASGIPKATIMAWTKDPQVAYEGKSASLFDLLEDLDYDACLAKAQAIAGVKEGSKKRPAGKQHAFVFIKPHAVTEATKKLAAAKFKQSGMTVSAEKRIGADAIEKKKLIDNHYYAIANKASLSKPAELNPPQPRQDEFEKKFGLSWPAALQRRAVYNAVDACALLGIDGVRMDRLWGDSKSAGNLVKFGGGFYAGKVEPPEEARAALAKARSAPAAAPAAAAPPTPPKGGKPKSPAKSPPKKSSLPRSTATDKRPMEKKEFDAGPNRPKPKPILLHGESAGVLGYFDVDEESKKTVAEQLHEAIREAHVRLSDLFREWDADSNGAVTRDEFHEAMRHVHFDAPRDKVDELFDEWDPDKSGSIDLMELQKIMHRYRVANPMHRTSLTKQRTLGHGSMKDLMTGKVPLPKGDSPPKKGGGSPPK